MKKWCALLLAAVTFDVYAASPQPGLWWSPSESGRGYGIDTQGNLLVLTMFGYGNDGRMQWYYADGHINADGTHWSGTLLKLDNGQPLNGAYRSPAIIGNDGVITLDFDSKTTGIVTLPGGRRVAIQRQNFGVGDAPQALLGQWLYAYSIGTANFMDRFNYTSVGAATSTGSGVVLDTARGGGAELQISGSLAGKVIAVQVTSSGTVTNQYLWTLMLEEGRGAWLAPTTLTQYGMNVYKTATPDGISKLESVSMQRDLEAKGSLPALKGISLDELAARDPELGRIVKEMWAVIYAR